MAFTQSGLQTIAAVNVTGHLWAKRVSILLRSRTLVLRVYRLSL